MVLKVHINQQTKAQKDIQSNFESSNYKKHPYIQNSPSQNHILYLQIKSKQQ